MLERAVFSISSVRLLCCPYIWFNMFPAAERDAAIISPIPGTTRDILSLTLDIGGFPVVLNDTAGIRSTTNDPIEEIGVQRAGNV